MSSLKDIPVPSELIIAGEVGLSGEIRAVSSAEQRAKEAERIGFTKIALPKKSIVKKAPNLSGASIMSISGVYEIAHILSSSNDAGR